MDSGPDERRRGAEPSSCLGDPQPASVQGATQPAGADRPGAAANSPPWRAQLAPLTGGFMDSFRIIFTPTAPFYRLLASLS